MAYELLSRQEVGNILANLRKTNEALVNDTIPAIVSVGTLQKVLCNLLREGVPIRDIEAILETLADYGATVKDLDMLTEYVRQSLRRTITHRFAEAGQLKVISLDANIENQIMAAVKKVDTGSYLALEPKLIPGYYQLHHPGAGKGTGSGNCTGDPHLSGGADLLQEAGGSVLSQCCGALFQRDRFGCEDPGVGKYQFVIT